MKTIRSDAERGFDKTLESIHNDLTRHLVTELFEQARKQNRAIFVVFEDDSGMPGLSNGLRLEDSSHLYKIFSEAVWRQR